MVIIQELVFLGKGLQDIQVFLLGQKIQVIDLVSLFDTRIDHHIPLVIDDGIQFLGRQSE